ncbi:uncharacterized mitochondrial protein-like protein [Tanacetum coccineum]
MANDSCDPMDTPMVEKSQKLDKDNEGKAVRSESHYRGMIGTQPLSYSHKWNGVDVIPDSVLGLLEVTSFYLLRLASIDFSCFESFRSLFQSHVGRTSVISQYASFEALVGELILNKLKWKGNAKECGTPCQSNSIKALQTYQQQPSNSSNLIQNKTEDTTSQLVPVVQQTGIQCFNCKGFGHYAKECRKPKRVKDYSYHKEKMMMCKQAEQGVPLHKAEQADC